MTRLQLIDCRIRGKIYLAKNSRVLPSIYFCRNAELYYFEERLEDFSDRKAYSCLKKEFTKKISVPLINSESIQKIFEEP